MNIFELCLKTLCLETLWFFTVCLKTLWFFTVCLFTVCQKTEPSNILHTLLEKHYNELLDRQGSERVFYNCDVFWIHLGTMYADFQEKIFAGIFGKKFQTLYSSNVTSIQSGIFSQESPRSFFLKIGILSAKVFTNNAQHMGCVKYCSRLYRVAKLNRE